MAGKCLLYGSQNLTWTEAHRFCRSNLGHLVVFDSLAQLIRTLRSLQKSGEFPLPKNRPCSFCLELLFAICILVSFVYRIGCDARSWHIFLYYFNNLDSLREYFKSFSQITWLRIPRCSVPHVGGPHFPTKLFSKDPRVEMGHREI